MLDQWVDRLRKAIVPLALAATVCVIALKYGAIRAYFTGGPDVEDYHDPYVRQYLLYGVILAYLAGPAIFFVKGRISGLAALDEAAVVAAETVDDEKRNGPTRSCDWPACAVVSLGDVSFAVFLWGTVGIVLILLSGTATFEFLDAYEQSRTRTASEDFYENQARFREALDSAIDCAMTASCCSLLILCAVTQRGLLELAVRCRAISGFIRGRRAAPRFNLISLGVGIVALACSFFAGVQSLGIRHSGEAITSILLVALGGSWLGLLAAIVASFRVERKWGITAAGFCLNGALFLYLPLWWRIEMLFDFDPRAELRFVLPCIAGAAFVWYVVNKVNRRDNVSPASRR